MDIASGSCHPRVIGSFRTAHTGLITMRKNGILVYYLILHFIHIIVLSPASLSRCPREPFKPSNNGHRERITPSQSQRLISHRSHRPHYYAKKWHSFVSFYPRNLRAPLPAPHPSATTTTTFPKLTPRCTSTSACSASPSPSYRTSRLVSCPVATSAGTTSKNAGRSCKWWE